MLLKMELNNGETVKYNTITCVFTKIILLHCHILFNQEIKRLWHLSDD